MADREADRDNEGHRGQFVRMARQVSEVGMMAELLFFSAFIGGVSGAGMGVFLLCIGNIVGVAIIAQDKIGSFIGAGAIFGPAVGITLVLLYEVANSCKR